MCLKPKVNQTSTNKQQGSMLVIALFVIIVLGLLGITITRLLASSADTIVHEVLGQRALNAARSGINCALANQFGSGCTQNTNHTFGAVPGLENCEYAVTANSQSIVDGAKSFTYWTFSSVGQCSAGNILVSRTVFVDAKL